MAEPFRPVATYWPKQLRAWAASTGERPTADELSFLAAVQLGAALGVGYGFMYSLVEWVFQDLHESCDWTPPWGPDYWREQFKAERAKVEKLRAAGRNDRHGGRAPAADRGGPGEPPRRRRERVDPRLLAARAVEERLPRLGPRGQKGTRT